MDGKSSSSGTGTGANPDDSKRPPTPPSPSSTGSDVSALELDSTKEAVIPGGEASAQEAAPLVGAIKSEMPSGSNLNTSGQSNVSSTSSSSSSTDLPTCSTEQTSLGESSSADPSVGHTKLVVAIPSKPSSAPASLQHAPAAPSPPSRVSQSDPGNTASSLGYVRSSSSNVDTTSTDAPLDPPALAPTRAAAQAAAPTIADDEGVHVDSKFSTQPYSDPEQK